MNYIPPEIFCQRVSLELYYDHTVDLENFGVKKLRKAHTSMKLKHMRSFY